VAASLKMSVGIDVGHLMTRINLFKQSSSVVVVALLQAVLPAVVSFVTLFLTVWAYAVPFEDRFIVLGVLASALSMVMLSNRSQPSVSEFQTSHWPAPVGVIIRWLLVLAILLLLGYATKYGGQYSRRVVLTWSVATPVVLIVAGRLLKTIMRRLVHSPHNFRTVVFAGCNEVSQSLAGKLRETPELCMRVSGFFDDRGAERLGIGAEVVLRGKLTELAEFVSRHGTDVIFISLPIRHIQRVLDLLESLRDTTASIYYVPDIFAFDLIQARTDEILGIPVVAMCETPFYGYRGVAKRLTDMVIGGLLLVLLSPLMLLIAVVVKLSSAGPVIFRQRRYGLDGQQISVYKFRTMKVTEDGPAISQATRSDGRITAVGRILRRFSLDELPQLVNVLQGRMSLVGPRPHAVAHNEEYRKIIKGYMVRHKVLPGITGLAQINGCRGETARVEEMQARVNYDLEYVRRWSPSLDLWILYQTALRLLRDDKAY
jgi:putative colanic acid biosysnthesis UDP-glucose lipid carrier transferase